MRYSIDENKRLATVYCTHADQESEEQQQTLKRFIADCAGTEKSLSASSIRATAICWRIPRNCWRTTTRTQ